MKKTTSTITVRYAETDQMKVVYHSNYLVWFEVGRTDFLKKNGYSYKQMEDEGLYLPVIEAYCRYKRPARYGDKVFIETELQEIKPTRIKLKYTLYRDNSVLAEGYTCHAFTSDSGKPLNISKSHPIIWAYLSKI